MKNPFSLSRLIVTVMTLLSCDAMSAEPISTPGNPVIGVQLQGGTSISVATAGNTAGANNYPAAESPTLAIDGVNTTKYLNFGGANTGIIINPNDNSSVVSGLEIVTGNDAPERDPATFSIYGTNVSQSTNFSDYTEIIRNQPILQNDPGRRSSSALVTFPKASRAYDSYLIVFPTLRNTTALMQIADLRLFADLGPGQVPAIPNHIPNVTQVPGSLLWRSPGTTNRITNIIYHNGWFYTNMVTGADRRAWRFGNNTSVSSFAQVAGLGDSNLTLFNDHGNHAHSKSGEHAGGAYGFGLKRQSLEVNVMQAMPEFETLTNYRVEGHTMYWPWKLPFHWVQYAGLNIPTPTYIRRPNQTRNGTQTLYEWNSLAEDGVTGNSILVGNLLFITSDELGMGILCYDISPVFNTPAQRPVLLDKLVGNFGAYIAVPFEHYLVLARQDSKNVEVIDFSDPTDLKHVASINTTGTSGWSGSTSVPYVQAQDNFIFTQRHKIDMNTFKPVLEFSQTGVGRPAGSVTGGVDTSQYMKPIGNLLVTAGYSFQETDRLAIWAHQAAPDTKKPYVGYHMPRPGQTNYPLGAPITLMIHEALESYTIVNGSSIILREFGTTTPLDCWTAFSHEGVLTLTPKDYLQLNKTYEVVVVNGLIKDAVGNGIEPHSFTFSTGSSVNGGNASPTINTFTANPSPVVPNATVNFSVSASDPENDPLQYRITYGDGSAITAWSSSNSFSRSYTTVGHYAAKLQVRDQKPGGLISVTSKDLVVTVGSVPSGTKPTNSSTIALDSTNRRVWVANADADTVSLLNADTNAKTAEFNLNTLLGISTSIDPRTVAIDTSGNAWIACHDADRVAVVSPSGTLIGQIFTGYGSAPIGVAITPNGSQAFVTLTGKGTLKRYSTSSRAETGSLDLGPTPRAIAITGDGTRVLVTRYTSAANRGSVWDVTNGSSLSLNRTYWIVRDRNRDTANNGRGAVNQLAGITISPDNQWAWITASKMNDEHGLFFAGAANTDNAVRAVVVRLELNQTFERENDVDRMDVDNSESPTSVAFSAIGDFAFVTLQGNNEIVVYDDLALRSGQFKTPTWRVPASLSPQGQVFDPATNKLFVNNFMSRSVSVLNLSAFISQGTRNAPTVHTGTVAAEKLFAQVLRGKQLFYNAGLTDDFGTEIMSRGSYVSCASCHNDGGQDGRVWDFTQRDEGLRNTIDLRGRVGTGHGNVHWTANFDEIQDFEENIRVHQGGLGFMSAETISAPLGASKAGQSSDLDALSAYVSSLNNATLPKSPSRNTDGTLTSSAQAGRTVFSSQNCASCHSGSQMTDSTGGVGVNPTLHNVGTLRTSSGMRLGGTLPGIDTPTLAGVHATSPYFHDGSAETLADVFQIAGGTVYQAEDASLSGSVIKPDYININYDNQPQKGSMIQWEGTGSINFSTIPGGGTSGTGAVEVRFNATENRTIPLTVRVNSTDYTLSLVGENFGHRREYITARLENVNLNSGNNTVVLTATDRGLIIDSITVSTPADLTKAQPHRRVLSLSTTDRDNLIQYLRELDGSSIAAIVAPNPGGTGIGGLVQFRSSYGLPSTGTQDTATPANDGVPNLLKYAFNMMGTGINQKTSLNQPNTAVLRADGSAGLPLVGIKNGTTQLQITYMRRKASSNPGVDYSVQFSSTMASASWAPNPSATEAITWQDAIFERVTVTDSINSGSGRFARVSVGAQ